MSTMKVDKFGQQIYNEKDLCSIFYQNPDIKIKNCLVEEKICFSDMLELANLPELIQYQMSNDSVEIFDQKMQSQWNMPEEYKNLDIAKWVLDQCSTDEQLQRVGTELLLYAERELFPLLKYLKFIVDIMRKYNIVWGVGRGSSVSSYVLYLIGVHKCDSIFYDLPIDEFLK